MTDVSAWTQRSFNSRWRDFGMRVANCVQGSSVFAITLPSSSSQGAGLRRRGNYEKSQTAARAGGGRLRRPARLAGTTGSRSPRRRATPASRAEQIDPRPEDHVETAGAQAILQPAVPEAAG